MRTRMRKIAAILLCVLLAAGLTGGAAAEQLADGEAIVEAFGQSLLQVLETIFDSRGDTAYASDWVGLKLAAMQGKPVIIVTGDITYGEGQDTIVFSKPVTLMSQEGEHFTIDGGGRQILCVQGPDAQTQLTSADTYLINLTFTGGDATLAYKDVYDTGSGGAVFVMGNVRAIGCAFTGNAGGIRRGALRRRRHRAGQLHGGG